MIILGRNGMNFSMSLHELVPILQLAIGPVILISGIGLLLLSMTNRYGRIIDRTRNLGGLIRKPNEGDEPHIKRQLTILFRRARMLRLAITFAAISLLLAAFLIIILFLLSLYNLEAAVLIVVLFISCMISLIASIIIFIMDIYMSLSALKLEISW
jgi:hypothetical protein